jgi:hypothetical protein
VEDHRPDGWVRRCVGRKVTASDLDGILHVSGNVTYWVNGDSLPSDVKQKVDDCLEQSAIA